MSQVGIFYGPQLGSVEKVARIIAELLGDDRVELVSVKNCKAVVLNRFDRVIFGISTIGKEKWDSEYNDSDWDVFSAKLKEVQWEGKKVAIYSLGDHVKYPEHFVDAIGWIYERLEKLDADVVGGCPVDDYEFVASEGVRDHQFLGLPVDEDNEPEKTPARVADWVKRLVTEHGF